MTLFLFQFPLMVPELVSAFQVRPRPAGCCSFTDIPSLNLRRRKCQERVESARFDRAKRLGARWSNERLFQLRTLLRHPHGRSAA